MAEKILDNNHTNRRKIIVFIACIGIVMAFFIQMNITKAITNAVFDDTMSLAAMTFKETLYAVSALLIAALLGRSPKKIFSSSPSPQKRRRRRYFMLMIMIYSPVMIFVNVTIQGLTDKGLSLRPWNEILLYIAFVFLIGVAEETLFRGIIAESMKRAWGLNDQGIASLLSGLLFGLIHLCNLSVAEPTGVLVQVCSATAAGILISDLYYFSGSLWPCIMFHSVVDFGGLLGFGLFGIGSFGEVVSAYSPVMCVVPLIMVIGRIVVVMGKRKNKSLQKYYQSTKYIYN